MPHLPGSNRSKGSKRSRRRPPQSVVTSGNGRGLLAVALESGAVSRRSRTWCDLPGQITSATIALGGSPLSQVQEEWVHR